MVDKSTTREELKACRDALSHHEQMLDAQAQCVPCKLCGGEAIITDAGTGAGYYIQCSNSTTWNDWKGCLIDTRRLSGWAYNAMEWWNRLHGRPTPDPAPQKGEVTQADELMAARIFQWLATRYRELRDEFLFEEKRALAGELRHGPLPKLLAGHRAATPPPSGDAEERQ